MARSVLTLGALLALFSVSAHAKSKADGLRLYAFASEDCNGPTIGGNLDIKKDRCFNLNGGGANSIRPFSHGSTNWIDEVNHFQGVQKECGLVTYEQFNCVYGHQIAGDRLPPLEQCISPDDTSRQILSVLFTCDKNILRCLDEPILSSTTLVKTLTHAFEHTSWKSESGSWSPSVGMTTLTETRTIKTVATPDPMSTFTVVEPPVHTVTVEVATVPALPVSTVYVTAVQKHLAARSDDVEDDSEDEPYCGDNDDCPEPGTPQSGVPQPTTTTALEARKWKGPRKGVYMYNPWTRAIICYDCYTKSSKNLEKFECRSGHNQEVFCNNMPDPEEEITTTIYPTTTVTLTYQADGQQMVHLEKRSWHKRVTFPHPFLPGNTVCADAEWEKRGQKKDEIRLQKPKTNMKKCDKSKKTVDIEIKKGTATEIGPEQTTTTTVILAPVPSTSTVTVRPLPPLTTSCSTFPLGSVTTVIVPKPSISTVTIPKPVLSTITIPDLPEVTTTTIVATAQPPPSIVTVQLPQPPQVVITTVMGTPQPAQSLITYTVVEQQTLAQRKEHTDL